LGLYEDIPHLLTPIVADAKKAANALNWAVREMEQRYKVLAQEGVRNIDQFNQLVDENDDRDHEEELERLPYIVIIVDELADLMISAGKEVEMAVTRLAQMARAVGIHLILATQRPSVDVLTGLIKANFPCRISFRVSSKVDSRTILDTNGAEQLLGMGDMLFLSPETARPIRIHGGFISEKEIENITKFLKRQAEPDYQEEVLEGEQDEGEDSFVDVGEMEDKLYDEATRFVVESGRASTSLLQRRFRIGYGRAARLLDMMEHEGIVGPSEGSRPREVLVPPAYFEEVKST
jgi:S-DNA-T family DNA segregation ATPase FtsK/SpoIIIE